MSANANVLGRSEMARVVVREAAELRLEGPPASAEWNPDRFAREQILALVRRVFLSLPSLEKASRHVIFSSAEAHSDVSGICCEVAVALSRETYSAVALVEAPSPHKQALSGYGNGVRSLKSCSEQLSNNLWRVPRMGIGDRAERSDSRPNWPSFLAELRSEFEYAVIIGPAVSESSDTAFLGQLTDGIVLVLSARTTRKATAQNIKEMLQQNRSRILGTILRDRAFPIPERIYRRL